MSTTRFRIQRVAVSVAYAVGLPILLIASWFAVSADSTNPFWPPLTEILAAIPSTWFDGAMTEDVLPSLYRLGIGYSIAVVLGITLGVIIGLSRSARLAAEPVLEFLRAVPPTVLIPVFMIVIGIGDTMKVVVIVVGCLWPVLLNTVEGVRAVDSVLRDTARTFGFDRQTKLFRVIIPGASPSIMVGARQALSLGIILMVVSEMFAATNGLGFTIVQFQRSFAIPQMWSGILLLGLIGVALSLIFRAVEHALMGWYRGSKNAERSR